MAIWTIRTHYKKSCEQHEHFYNRKIDDAKIIEIDISARRVKLSVRAAQIDEEKS